MNGDPEFHWGKSNQWTDSKHLNLTSWTDLSEYQVIVHWLTIAATFAGIAGTLPVLCFFALVYSK